MRKFGKEVESFKEQLGHENPGGAPTVEANLTEDYFFEMMQEDEAEEEGGGERGGDLDKDQQEREGMEGFGAAGSAELASRSYEKAG